jgi:hypothetical protein
MDSVASVCAVRCWALSALHRATLAHLSQKAPLRRKLTLRPEWLCRIAGLPFYLTDEIQTNGEAVRAVFLREAGHKEN